MKIAVLGSGKGSNFVSILEAIDKGLLRNMQIVLVASDHADAGILERAHDAGLPTYIIQETQYRTRLSHESEEKLLTILQSAGVEIVVLAGYMRIIKTPLLDAFPRRIINIHPSLLPSFPGMAAWQQALEAGVVETGCTVHYVDSGVDTGEIIAQMRVPVLPDDTATSLHARIQVAEHELLPAVLEKLCAPDQQL